MLLTGVELIRSKVAAYAPLVTWAEDKYGKAIAHALGIVAPQNAENYPFISYGILSETDLGYEWRKQVIAISFFLNQSAIDENTPSEGMIEYRGERELAEMG
ncbi:MAG: hypothetical protein GY862_25305, partial [Gammaproteobacteria bacterium]|nr:hypothetical protein [Gammaproteobacteria bacterium]